MNDDRREIIKSLQEAHIRNMRRIMEKQIQKEPRISNELLLTSPFGKKAEDAKLTLDTGRQSVHQVLAPQFQQGKAEPDLWMSSITMLVGLLLLFRLFRRIWE